MDSQTLDKLFKWLKLLGFNLAFGLAVSILLYTYDGRFSLASLLAWTMLGTLVDLALERREAG